ncbi:hypothetical protein ACJX0J_028143, partial [Zea mays]
LPIWIFIDQPTMRLSSESGASIGSDDQDRDIEVLRSAGSACAFLCVSDRKYLEKAESITMPTQSIIIAFTLFFLGPIFRLEMNKNKMHGQWALKNNLFKWLVI